MQTRPKQIVEQSEPQRCDYYTRVAAALMGLFQMICTSLQAIHKHFVSGLSEHHKVRSIRGHQML